MHPIQKCRREVKSIIRVNDHMLDLLVLPMLCGGHALVHGMVGTAKTMTVLALARTLGLDFGAYQCHPDTMPGDLLGFERYDQKTQTFSIHKGPVMLYQFVLMDEINRMPPKSQAALLAPMGQRMVTIGTQETRDTRDPFVVYATLNPIESAGVYPLAEAQIDRFLLQIPWPYHTYEDSAHLMEMRNAERTRDLIDSLQPVEGIDVAQMRADVDKISIGSGETWQLIVALYLVCCPSRTIEHRGPSSWSVPKETDQFIHIGPSPRALRDLAQAVKGIAYLRWTESGASDDLAPSPADVERVAIPVLRHRLILERMLPEDYRSLPAHARADRFLEEIAVPLAKERAKALPIPAEAAHA